MPKGRGGEGGGGGLAQTEKILEIFTDDILEEKTGRIPVEMSKYNTTTIKFFV